MEERVTFMSDGLELSGVVHTPDDLAPGERRPAFMVLHGFGSKKESNNCTGPAKMLCEWGYVALRFDYRGEPDVSFLPRSFDSLIDCAGLSYIRRAYFQFKQKKLYIMTLVLNRDKIDHFSIFTRLSDKYGPFTDLTPSKVTWDFDELLLTLERPLSIKYVDKKTFAEVQEAGKPDPSLRDISRDRFLENF